MKIPPGFTESSAPPERVLADRVEDDVVRLAVLREVLARVVDDVVGAERPHELDVLRVADGRDLGAEVLRQLHGGGADGSGGAVDRRCSVPAAVWAFLRHARAMIAPSEAAAASSKLQAGRLVRDDAVLPHADVLRVGAASDPEDLVADLELRDRCADRPRPRLRAPCPGVRRFGRRSPVNTREKNGSAARKPQSERVTEVAWTLTSTSSSFGTGRGTSSSRSTSGGPYRSWTTALMRSRPLFRPGSARRCRSSARCPRTGAPRPRPRAGRCGRSRRGTRRSRAAA